MEAMPGMKLQREHTYSEKKRGPRTELKKTLKHTWRKWRPQRRPRRNTLRCRRKSRTG